MKSAEFRSECGRAKCFYSGNCNPNSLVTQWSHLMCA